MNQYTLLKIIFNTMLEMFPQADEAYKCFIALKEARFNASYKGGSSLKVKFESLKHPEVSEIVITFNADKTLIVDFIQNDKINIILVEQNQEWHVYNLENTFIKKFSNSHGEYPYQTRMNFNNMNELSQFINTF